MYFSHSDSACAELQIKLVTESEVSEEVINRARKFGVEFHNDCTDPKNYLTAFLKKLLLQREKLKEKVLDEYLGEGTPQWWDELLTLLEEENRKLLNVEAGSIIFTLFCPTKESFEQMSDASWRRRVDCKLHELLEYLGRHFIRSQERLCHA